MKTGRQLSLVFVLTLLLAHPAAAGDVSTPGLTARGEIGSPGLAAPGDGHGPGLLGDIGSPGVTGIIHTPGIARDVHAGISYLFSLFGF